RRPGVPPAAPAGGRPAVPVGRRRPQALRLRGLGAGLGRPGHLLGVADRLRAARRGRRGRFARRDRAAGRGQRLRELVRARLGRRQEDAERRLRDRGAAHRPVLTAAGVGAARGLSPGARAAPFAENRWAWDRADGAPGTPPDSNRPLTRRLARPSAPSAPHPSSSRRRTYAVSTRRSPSAPSDLPTTGSATAAPGRSRR